MPSALASSLSFSRRRERGVPGQCGKGPATGVATIALSPAGRAELMMRSAPTLLNGVRTLSTCKINTAQIETQSVTRRRAEPRAAPAQAIAQQVGAVAK